MAEPSISRRELLMPWLRAPARADTGTTRWHPRPPGAVREARFLSLCDGCGACAEACPERAIGWDEARPTRSSASLGSARTPRIRPEQAPCVLCEGMPCAVACPTDALTPVPTQEARIGVVRVLPDRCWTGTTRCDYCVRACPTEPPALTRSSQGIAVDADACTGCGQCVYVCATTPRALEIVPRRASPTRSGRALGDR